MQTIESSHAAPLVLGTKKAASARPPPGQATGGAPRRRFVGLDDPVMQVSRDALPGVQVRGLHGRGQHDRGQHDREQHDRGLHNREQVSRDLCQGSGCLLRQPPPVLPRAASIAMLSSRMAILELSWSHWPIAGARWGQRCRSRAHLLRLILCLCVCVWLLVV